MCLGYLCLIWFLCWQKMYQLSRQDKTFLLTTDMSIRTCHTLCAILTFVQNVSHHTFTLRAYYLTFILGSSGELWWKFQAPGLPNQWPQCESPFRHLWVWNRWIFSMSDHGIWKFVGVTPQDIFEEPSGQITAVFVATERPVFLTGSLAISSRVWDDLNIYFKPKIGCFPKPN